RCGVPDHPAVTESELKLRRERLGRERRRKRFSVFGGRWEKTDLTYKILRFPWQMSEAKVQHVLQEAFGVWSAVSPLRFREVTSDQADIIIDFNRYWHGDSLPFDGPGILAHAFFPRTHRQGEVHFDYDEHWTVGNDLGMDLLQVAAHEFGHVLGLQHSLEPGAVMSPFYSESYPPRLSQDDVRGIQYLYGPPLTVPPQTGDTNEIDMGTGGPHVSSVSAGVAARRCATSFDAVSTIRGELFFFKSGYVWRLRERQLQQGYPALASRHWRGLPRHVDAAYEDASGNICSSKVGTGDQYWVFDAERQIRGPDLVWSLGLPVSNIQAALKWHQNGVEKAYLLKSASYWSLDPQQSRVDDFYPHSMWEWEGVPGHVDAAFQDRQGYANFLSGLHYWRLDPATLKVLEGYPRSIGADFFGCA
uniref:Matrix metallopeptidase 11 n=1 Tax=Tetraodon nigroviridis TaxID=99883 RepID=H3CNS4_TETNG